MNYKLYFPTDFEYINSTNDNIDVCIELPDGKQYTVVVATPQNVQEMMKSGGNPYLEPSTPFLFVEELTDYNIRLLVDRLIQDSVLLRTYGEDLWQ